MREKEDYHKPWERTDFYRILGCLCDSAKYIIVFRGKAKTGGRVQWRYIEKDSFEDVGQQVGASCV